jgi:hypothetical protein
MRVYIPLNSLLYAILRGFEGFWLFHHPLHIKHFIGYSRAIKGGLTRLQKTSPRLQGQFTKTSARLQRKFRGNSAKIQEKIALKTNKIGFIE